MALRYLYVLPGQCGGGLGRVHVVFSEPASCLHNEHGASVVGNCGCMWLSFHLESWEAVLPHCPSDPVDGSAGLGGRWEGGLNSSCQLYFSMSSTAVLSLQDCNCRVLLAGKVLLQ